MSNNWFEGCKTIEEIKKRYRTLAQKYHPDHGGSNDDMVQINLQYEKMCAWAKNHSTTEQDKDFNINDGFREVINKIINLNIDIEIIGCWIWVTGNTKPHKDTLKQAGFWWASKKCVWYWKPADFVKRNKQEMKLDDIRNKYGSNQIKTAQKVMAIG